jgi:hypothetical protein
MNVKSKAVIALFALLFLLTLGLSVASARDEVKSPAIVKDHVIAGGPNDYLEVRHVVLKGSNAEIGRALAQLAQERFQARPQTSHDPLRTRVQRQYLEKNCAILYERMKGAAAHFGGNLEDDSLNFNGLGYTPKKPGCSVIYFPPSTTAEGTGIVSRDYDFTLGTLQFTRPPVGELGATARPYLVELHPDKGYASIAMHAYDLLGGTLDGMNSEGLTVALLADDELHSKYKMEPAFDSGVGLGALQMQRYLLDTCANVEEAKSALLMTKQFYEFISVHYLIADRHGKSFVWEHSQAHNKEYIIENDGKPLITTNFSLHKYLDGHTPPSAEQAKKVCPRYCKLAEKIGEHSDKVTVDFIKKTHKLVDATHGNGLSSAAPPPNRTLWHVLYFPEKRAMQVSYYLRDEADPETPGKAKIVRSEYMGFQLPAVGVSSR